MQAYPTHSMIEKAVATQLSKQTPAHAKRIVSAAEVHACLQLNLPACSACTLSSRKCPSCTHSRIAQPSRSKSERLTMSTVWLSTLCAC